MALAVVALLVGFGVWFSWYKFYREEDVSVFNKDDPVERFKYGSMGGEGNAGIPYWIWVVLPRIFPDLLPGPGGWKSFGVIWEEGHELPVGFTKKIVGFPRVGNNCALCHTATYRTKPDQVPTVVVGAPANTLNVQGMINFLAGAASDPRFNPDTILDEVDRDVRLSFLDRQLYRFLIIPLTRKALVEQGRKLAWMNRPGVPRWGPGRDDAFNLPKYVVAELPLDDSVGQCDFGSVWNLKIRGGPGLLLNWAGETPSIRSVIVDSSLGLGVRPGAAFEARVQWLDKFLSNLPSPKFPFPVDATLAAAGQTVYQQHCAECHEAGKPRTNHVIPIEEIQTDRRRLDTWTQAAANAFNRKVSRMGFERPPVGKNNGYLSPPLDGLWMRAPYLHNGSVPTLRDLLNAPNERPQAFHRGYDVFDPVKVGFKEAPPRPTGPNGELTQPYLLLDTGEKGNGNQGHTYGTQLSNEDKEKLLEYLRTL